MSPESDTPRAPRVDFSAVIPTYNRAELLPRALRSIIGQSYPPREIIVVDDGSGDHTARLVQDNFPQVRYYYQRHAGVSAARNHGIAVAKSRWIALLDSDDAWLPEKLARQTEAILAHPDVRLVHTNERWIRNGSPLGQKRQHRKYGGRIFEHCLARCVISPSSAVIRRDVFRSVGGFDESLKACEDYDFWLRFCAREPVVFIDEPLLTKFGGHPDQLSRSVPALDQYRIETLCKLLDSDVLNETKRKLTVATLAEKYSIFVNGAAKRGRQAEVDKYTRLVERFIDA